MLQRSIGVAPITQVTHVRNKNSNTQVRSLNAIKMISHTIRNCSQMKEFAPFVCKLFPLIEVLLEKRIIAWSSSLPLMSIYFERSGYAVGRRISVLIPSTNFVLLARKHSRHAIDTIHQFSCCFWEEWQTQGIHVRLLINNYWVDAWIAVNDHRQHFEWVIRFCFVFYVSVNSYGHVETVSSPKQTFPGQN